MREIVGAVDRVDDPCGAVVDPLDQRRICRHCFLADDAGTRQDFGQARAQPLLAFLVGDCDQIAGCLLGNLMLGEVLIILQHHLAGDGADQGGNAGVEGMGHVSGIITLRA